jgi:hypothetical protein
MDQPPSYLEELIILTVIGFLLLIAKLAACCLSLGLHQNHKAINLRQDNLSVARLNNLQVERINREKKEEIVTCTCKCCTCKCKNPRSLQRSPTVEPSFFPKLESANSCLDIPEKILVCGRIRTADTPSVN